MKRRDSIAWCDCGNVSVDGFNFGGLERGNGWLLCFRCGAEGPWEFTRVDTEPPAEPEDTNWLTLEPRS